MIQSAIVTDNAPSASINASTSAATCKVAADIRTVGQPAPQFGRLRTFGRHDADRDLGGGNVIPGYTGPRSPPGNPGSPAWLSWPVSWVPAPACVCSTAPLICLAGGHGTTTTCDGDGRMRPAAAVTNDDGKCTLPLHWQLTAASRLLEPSISGRCSTNPPRPRQRHGVRVKAQEHRLSGSTSTGTGSALAAVSGWDACPASCALSSTGSGVASASG
jgi:hypothetical protein